MSTPIERVNAKIERLRQQLRKLESLHESMEDPDLADVFGDDNGVAHAERAGSGEINPGKRNSTAFETVMDFFRLRNNEWSSSKQIREGTGLERGAISNLIYHQRKDKFEKRQEEGQPIQWRIKEVK